MIGVPLIFALAFGCEAPHAPSLTIRDKITASGTVVTFSDAADLQLLPGYLRAAIANMPLTSAPQKGAARHIKRDRLIERMRARAPMVAEYLPPADAQTYVVIEGQSAQAESAASPETARCALVLKAIEPGQVVVRSDLQAGLCTGAPKLPRWRYDPIARVLRSDSKLQKDQEVSAPPESLLSEVREGQSLILAYHAGPVALERVVTVVRASPRGKPILVRASNGDLITAPPIEAAP